MLLLLTVLGCKPEQAPEDTEVVVPAACPVQVAADAADDGDGSVDAPYARITSAVESLPEDCYRIEVGPGTYPESVELFGDFELVATSGPEQTIIAPPGGSGLVVQDGQGPDTVVDGFTIEGGTGTPGPVDILDEARDYGGGLFVFKASPTVRNCVIRDNSATGTGGGVLLHEYDGLFEGNVVQDNVTTTEKEFGGGGVYLYLSYGELNDNVFQGNRHEGEGADGGGLLIRRGAPRIEANVFQDNVAVGSGGGLRSSDADPVVLNNAFIGNTPDAAAFSYDDGGVFAHNTVVASLRHGLRFHAPEEFYEGDTGPTTVVVNNIFAASAGYGVYVNGVASPERWQANLFWDNASGSFGGEEMEGLGTDYEGDPLLSEAYVPDAESPAVDGGIDASEWTRRDLYGQERPLGSGWDIGAVEAW